MNKQKIAENIFTIGVRDSDDFELIKVNLEVDELLFMNQIHSSDILDARVSDNLVLLRNNEACVDGVIVKRSEFRNVGLVVKTADCLPIFIFNDVYCIAIHAGWKGLSLGIQRGINKFFSDNDLSKLEVVVGPHAINGYEVKDDVLSCFENPVIKEDLGKTFLNMQDILCNDLIKLGIKKDNIKLSSHCTINDTRFYSYRRDKLEKKRNLNVFILK